jgi:hypothetical protein
MGLAACRRSPFPADERGQRGVGGPLIPFNGIMSHRQSAGRFGTGLPTVLMPAASLSGAMSTSGRLHRWELGFR